MAPLQEVFVVVAENFKINSLNEHQTLAIEAFINRNVDVFAPENHESFVPNILLDINSYWRFDLTVENSKTYTTILCI